jgi:hypothetical protein
MAEVTPQELGARLDTIAAREEGPKFFGRPDRWYETPHWRCVNNHVSRRYLISELGDFCLACMGPVRLTFPEDVDGPLTAPGS